MKYSFKFFQNKDCEYFPCHCINKGRISKDNFNCLFCFCPLYYRDNCGGNYTILANNIKDCSKCLIPHFNYDYIIKRLKK